MQAHIPMASLGLRLVRILRMLEMVIWWRKGRIIYYSSYGVNNGVYSYYCILHY